MKFSLSRTKQRLLAFASLVSVSSLSFATTVAGSGGSYTCGASDPTFCDFAGTVRDWATGPLGVGLATSMLLIGAGIGVAKNSPMPALSGVAGAAFLHWGPGIITQMMGSVI